jgi:hypothetical protein
MIISMREQLARLAAEVAAMPVADDRTPEEIIGYETSGCRTEAATADST